jgi:hypothetical protein
VNTPPFWPANVPSQTNYLVGVGSPFTVTNTASDSDIPTNALVYNLLAAPSGAVISADGLISWTPSLAQADTTNLFTTVVTDINPWAVNATSLSATNNFTVTVAPLPFLTGGQPQTNSIPPGGFVYYAITVPTNADFATNILIFAGLPVDILFNQTGLPVGTNVGDFFLLSNVTSGTGTPNLATNGFPPLVLGATYYLGLANTNAAAVSAAIEVDFHFVPVLPAAVNISIIIYTNGGFLLTWFAPTNDQFQVQWSTNLAPPVWAAFPVTNTSTTGTFTFMDTNAFLLMKFYQLFLLP